LFTYKYNIFYYFYVLHLWMAFNKIILDVSIFWTISMSAVDKNSVTTIFSFFSLSATYLRCAIASIIVLIFTKSFLRLTVRFMEICLQTTRGLRYWPIFISAMDSKERWVPTILKCLNTFLNILVLKYLIKCLKHNVNYWIQVLCVETFIY